MSIQRNIIAEVKRRGVVRPAMLYGGAVWACVQGLSQFSPILGLPAWITRWFLIAAIIGFPLWIALAWFYELTPQGLQREGEVAPDAPVRRANARKLDLAIICVLVIAVALLGSGYFLRGGARESPQTEDFAPPGGTLVVLPFKNLDGDPKQQYFSDGITQELIGTLGRNPALRIIAWDTASRYRDSQKDAKAIGRILNVANVLSGSIERASGEVRVHVGLTNTVTGFEVWSHHFDSAFADIFTVQDQIARDIATALEVRFSQGDLPKGGTHNPQAHELVLKSLSLMSAMDAASLTAARTNLEQAISLDPDYADAHALLAQVLLGLTQHADLPLKSALPMIHAHAQRALALDPENANAWTAQGLAWDNEAPRQIDKAKQAFVKAIAIDPSNNAARTDYALDLPLKAARSEVLAVTEINPYDIGNWNNMAVYDQDLGDWSHMVLAANHLAHSAPSFLYSAFYLAFAYQQLHEYDKMVQAFDLVKTTSATSKQTIDAGRQVYKAVRDPKLRSQALAALAALWRSNSRNQDVAYTVIQMYLALGDAKTAMPILKGYCLEVPVACSDLAINPVYLPLREQPEFAKLARQYTTIKLE